MMPSGRVLIAIVLITAISGLALFLWQKQIQGYDFSLRGEEEIFSGLNQAVKDFGEELPTIEPSDALLEAIRAYQNSTTSASSTISDERIKSLFEELEI